LTHSIPNQEPPPRPDRPAGVSILTIWNGFVGGGLPILAAIGLFRQNPDASLSPSFCLSVGLAAGILFTSIGAFRGNDPSRLGMLLLITLHHSLAAFEPLSVLVYQGQPDAIRLRAWGRIINAIFWTTINIWYFLRPKTLFFYRYRRG
jgi:hypothetical protein